MNAAFIQLALNILQCSQKELAIRLGVSPTQITKWKNGEYMSLDMERKFRSLVNIGDRLPEFILMTGSLEQAIKWESLIDHLADVAEFDNETGYQAAPLKDMPELTCHHTMKILQEMGLPIPRTFPSELDFDYDGANDQAYEILESNIYSNTISKMFKSFTDVYGFYAAFISDLMFDDKLELDNTEADNIEPCLLDLAASKIEIDEAAAPNFKSFRCKVQKDYRDWIEFVKSRAFRAGVPLKAELMHLVHAPHDELGQEADAEGLGLNSSRLHPDIYMNELLCGMRAIHQVLPAILKKLGIEEEFKLDTSEFYTDSRSS